VEFKLKLTSVRDVQDFVALATAQPFPITVGNELHRVNGKSFMEMFSLNYNFPVTARLECSEAEFSAFCLQAARFVG